MSDWISVDDRLPEDQYELVLVWLSDSNVSPVMWPPKLVRKNVKNPMPAWSVTHWMPLPEPPWMPLPKPLRKR